MRYSNIISGRFIRRVNRFVAEVEVNGRQETVHVKNTGRCRELLLPGADVILTRSDNPARKTSYDLIEVYKLGLGLVNIDSQALNAVVKEWLETLPFDRIRPEYTFGNSRIDFYMEYGNRRYMLEVKGCTLDIDGIGYFPDAPTERGVKHLHELTRAAQEGITAAVAFVIPMPGITKVLPNDKTQPEFGRALEKAEEAGVHVLYLPCRVKPDELTIDTIQAEQLNAAYLDLLRIMR